MQTVIFLEANEIKAMRASLAEANGIAEIDAKLRDNMDARQIVELVLEYANPDDAALFFAFLLGTRTRFSIDHDGMKIEVKNLKILSKLIKAWKTVNDDDAKPKPAPPIKKD